MIRKCQANFQRASPALFSGKIRSKNEDFIVEEIPSITPTGNGEHICLKIKKSGENTDWLARQLAKIAGVKRRDVSYAGMKDRHAVTTQWFSIYHPKPQSFNWQAGLPETVEILEETRHERKLRLGTLQGNQFQLIIRDCQLLNNNTHADIANRIEYIRQHGIPNYFGEQRFGRNFNNLQKAEDWFSGKFKPKKRNLQSIFLSAARSWIFNQILSERVKQQTWNHAIAGDVFMLDGSKSWFIDDIDETITQRIQAQEIHPTGALWGKGKLASQADMRDIEEKIAKQYPILSEGLCQHKLKQERRRLRLSCKDITAKWLDEHRLQLNFSLTAGAYATSVLQELMILE